MSIDYSIFPDDVAEALKSLDTHYEYSDFNDRGANGYLVFAENRVSKMHVAIKFYSGEPGARQHDEPRLLSTIRSSNVLQIFDARRVSDDWAFFVTPRCFEGDLDDLLRTGLSAHRAVDITLGVCSGVSALHARNMVHRDLKPGNIVLQSGTPRIADFGSVRTLELNREDVTASRHSVLYRPPESFSTNRYGIKGDVYQVGLVAYQLLGGKLSYDWLDYFTKADVTEYKRLSSAAEQSLFCDAIIRARAEAGTLADFASLPGWVDAGSKRALRRMIHRNVSDRLSSMVDVAAEVTAMRARIGNWGWDNGVARLVSDGSTIELRPNGAGSFVAFKDGGTGFRRIPKLAAASVVDLVAKLDA